MLSINSPSCSDEMGLSTILRFFLFNTENNSLVTHVVTSFGFQLFTTSSKYSLVALSETIISAS